MTARRWQAVCLTIALSTMSAIVIFWTRNVLDESLATVKNKMVSDRPTTKSLPNNDIDPSIVDYIGSTACRDCHREIWEKYQSHPMATSCSQINPASTVEDYSMQTEFSPPGNRRYRVEKTDDGIRHHEIMVDQAGEEIYDQSVPVEFVIGSGKRGRAFVINRDGLLFKSSISWYSDQHNWGLSPDYLPESHLRFERRVTGGCVTCHSGTPNFIRTEADRFRTPPFLEAAIGCERCHGPGKRHVAARESGDAMNDPIVNPGNLDVDRREAVCAQCHLHGESRILRTGRTPHDFRPGERIDENWLIFVKSHGTGITRSGRAASQVEHMASSVCFERSEGRMGCTSCHDPHSIPEKSNKYEYYRQRCLKCHAEKGCSLPIEDREASPQSDHCTKCHMPSVPSTNVLHRSIADHRILRRPSEDSLEGTGESKLFQFTVASIPDTELIRARAFKMIDDAGGPPINPELAQEAYRLLLPLIADSPKDPELYAGLGNCCQMLNQLKQSVQWRLHVLKLNPRHEKTVQNLALVFHENYQVIPAEQYLKRFIELNPWIGSYHDRLAGTLMFQKDVKGAIASAEKALELNPTLWQLHGMLANAYSQTGDTQSAAKHEKLLQRMRPADGK